MKHKEEILKLRAEGKTYNEIKEITGASKGTISYHCGEGQKEKSYARNSKARKKINAIFRKIKEDRGCMDCKLSFPHYVLEFDHVPERGEKKGSPAIVAYNKNLEEGWMWQKICQSLDEKGIYEKNRYASKDDLINQNLITKNPDYVPGLYRTHIDFIKRK